MIGDQLVGDRVAVGAEVGRVDGVGVVVVRVGVLDLDDHHPRIVRAGPLLVELVGVLLLDPVVAGQVKPLAVLGLEVRVGGLLAEARERLREMAVEDDQGITGVGMRVEALGQQDVGAQVHGPAPELRQPLALDRLVLDVLASWREAEIGGIT